MNKFSALLAVLVLSACGGGSPDPDVATFAVIPPEITYGADPCPGPGVAGEVSVHTINGGRQPFRVRSVVAGVEVGLSNANNEFVAATKSADGDLIILGRDPKFAIRATLGCTSDIGVTVLDETSLAVEARIKVEAAE